MAQFQYDDDILIFYGWRYKSSLYRGRSHEFATEGDKTLKTGGLTGRAKVPSGVQGRSPVVWGEAPSQKLDIYAI